MLLPTNPDYRIFHIRLYFTLERFLAQDLSIDVKSRPMGARAEVESHIYSNWADRRVANWVIKSLPLLERGFTHPPCPVYSLSLENGLEQKNDTPFPGEFKTTSKIVISGGFEGTYGHLMAIKDVHEVRAITAKDDSFVVLMLEQDSYIVNRKKRSPMVNIDQREKLWSTSGLVDAVILLPDQDITVNLASYFSRVHELIQPAVWCANIENKYWREIISRGELNQDIEAVRITDFESYLHTSFLASTMNFESQELKVQLYNYVLELVKKTETPQVLENVSPEEIAKIVFERVADGL